MNEMFIFNKCEEPRCLESGKVYQYPFEKGKKLSSTSSIVLCEEHAANNGFCFWCNQFQGFSAWFHNSGLCEECFDDYEADFDETMND